MSIERFFTRTATVLTAGTVDDGYGDEPDWDNPTSTTVKGWLHRLDESEEGGATPPREADIGAWVFRCAADTPITSANRLVIDGQTFHVDGPPHLAHTPRGPHHLRVPLRTSEG